MKRETKLGFAAVAMAAIVATTIAAVPGIFSSVDSVSGYSVNGSAGSSGQALCSDGSHFNTPCALSGGVLIKSNGVSQPNEPAINFLSGFTITDSPGVSTNIALTGSSSVTNPGYVVLPNGLIIEWKTGVLQSDSGSTQTITFPLTCPTGLFQVQPGSITTFDDTSMPTFVVTSQSTSSVTLGMQRVPDHSYEPATPTITVFCH